MVSAHHKVVLTRPLILATMALLISLVATAAQADKVWLDNGNFLEGSAREMQGEVEIASSLGIIRVPSSRVTRIERSATIEQKVRDFLDQNPRYSAEDLYELALESKAEGSSTLANLLFEKTLRLDADHEGARRALGYRHFEGRWVTEKEHRDMRGEVLFRGDWVSAETKARILNQESDRLLAASQQRLLAAQIVANQEANRQRSQAGSGSNLPGQSYYPTYPAYPGSYGNGPRIPYDQLPPAMPRFRKPQDNDRPLKPPRLEGKSSEQLRSRNG